MASLNMQALLGCNPRTARRVPIFLAGLMFSNNTTEIPRGCTLRRTMQSNSLLSALRGPTEGGGRRSASDFGPNFF
eukprot:3920665-Rhodomonas_salina.2